MGFIRYSEKEKMIQRLQSALIQVMVGKTEQYIADCKEHYKRLFAERTGMKQISDNEWSGSDR